MRPWRKVSDTLRARFRLAAAERLAAAPVPAARADDRRLLLLVGEFAPAVAGGVYRPAALARYAQRAGWDVTVVTAPAPDRPSQAGLDLLAYVGTGVRIIRFEQPSLVPSVRMFPRVDGSLVTALSMATAARQAFGDDLPARIVASGPPFCSHVAAMWLAGRSNRQVILECRDEWTSCPFDFVDTGGDNRAWEWRCLQRADRVVVTTESQQRQLVFRFGPAFEARCIVAPNGWEPSESGDAGVLTAGAAPGPLVLTFAGKLGGHTDAGRFLQALARLLDRSPDWRQRLRVRFVGARRDDAQRQLDTFRFPEVLDVLPVVPLATATRLMRESSALLLFHDPRFERYLPGKLYEYAASGQPVLLFDDAGESHRVVTGQGLGWSIHSDDDRALETVLQALHDRTRDDDRTSEVASRRNWVARHTRERLTLDFLRLLESMPVKPSS